MFWKKKDPIAEAAKQAKPREVPAIVQKYLVSDKKVDPEYTPLFKSVIHNNGTAGSDIRIFDESDALARKVEVSGYNSLDNHPEMIIWEGHFDEAAKKVELVDKNKLTWDTKIYTQDEIQKMVETLTQPGSTVSFYQARGGQAGGPLSKGCNIIELNPSFPDKKQKKYNIYVSDVVDLKPTNKGEKLWDSDKPKEIAGWVAQGHHKRLYS